VAERLLAATWK